jgi:hypothetical protein
MCIHVHVFVRLDICYARSRKVSGSSPDEVFEFFQFTLLSQPHYAPEIYSVSNRNEYRNFFLG